jgi:hypothetical protein
MENNEQPTVEQQPVAPSVQALVDKAFNESVEQAIEAAKKIGPASVDELHKALSEPKVHQALLERGKISPAP